MLCNNNKISSFWNWFISINNNFGKNFDNTFLLAEIDKQIHNLGDYTWELGPGISDSKNNSLVISPGGHRELLQKSIKIIQLAPTIPGWELYYAKQPKEWDRFFFIKVNDKVEMEINAKKWNYVLIKFPDETFDLIIQAPELYKYVKDVQMSAMEIVIDAEIGEENRINFIENIELVAMFDDDLRGSESPINVLSQHFLQVKPKRN